jgi:hypothetical protein
MQHTGIAGKAVLILAGWLLAAAAGAERGRYLDHATFLELALAGRPHEAGVVWIDADLRRQIEAVLGHDFPLLRVRYWHSGDTTAWVLDEVGKEEPITVGVSIEADRVALVRILEFRESRGWEVRYPFFTAQFDGVRLKTGAQGGLDRAIDGISGATLSVRAVSRVVEAALLLDSRVAGAEPVVDLASDVAY